MVNFYIQQDICINVMRIEGLSNSSVLQVGAAGMIKPISNLYNTGNYTKPAPQLTTGTQVTTEDYAAIDDPYVPLPAPS